jgi:hypothetical protein
MLCVVGWHSWWPAGKRVACRRCRHEAAVRPRGVVIAHWLLVAIMVVTLALAGVALNVWPGFERFAPSVEALGPFGKGRVLSVRSVLVYDVYGGFALVAILAAVLVGMRGLFAWTRWAAIILLPLFMLGQVMFISTDPASSGVRSGLLPEWYPVVQHMLELSLFLAALAVVILLVHESSRAYFDEGTIDRTIPDDEISRALAAVRRKRARDGSSH